MKFEYREQLGYSQEISARTLESAMKKAQKILRSGDWPDVEDGETLYAKLAVLDQDGNQIDVHTVSVAK